MWRADERWLSVLRTKENEGKKPRTELDEKLFAVAFIAALSPALPPEPVMKLHPTSNAKRNGETVEASTMQSSYICLIPK